uniref:Uncharacterized protein n=1 Tax=Hyaloperonospora arabidopsidis (strain Emoy2) TaxID=559515 RepID=M4BD82_HYAAE
MLGAAGRLQETLVAAARRGPLECCEQMMGGEEARFDTARTVATTLSCTST